MALSWIRPWELVGRWAPAGEAERTTAEESLDEKHAQPRVPEPQSTAKEESAAAATLQHDGREGLFESPWPAYGVLRFSPSDGLRMEAFGPFSDPFASHGSFPLWGETLDGSPCSLVPAWIAHEGGTLGAHAKREIVGSVFALGAHLRDLRELEIQRARLQFVGLREFLWHPHRGPVGLLETEPSDRADSGHEQGVKVPGARLTFRLAWESKAAQHERRATRVGEIDILLDEAAPFETWMRDWMRPLRDLLVFAMREPSRLDRFVALFDAPAEPLWWKPHALRGVETREVELVQRESRLLLETPRWGYRRLLFSLGELDDEADRVLASWFAIHRRLEPAADFLFSALNTRLHLENAVLNLTSAAEGYHRAFNDEQRLTSERHAELTAAMLSQCATGAEREVFRSRLEFANSPSQRRRLTLLYRRAARVIPQRRQAIEAHVNQLIETRNYFIHHDVRSEDVREGDELSLLVQRLVMVLQANLMCDLGWPEQGAAGFLRRSYEGQRVLQIAETEQP